VHGRPIIAVMGELVNDEDNHLICVWQVGDIYTEQKKETSPLGRTILSNDRSPYCAVKERKLQLFYICVREKEKAVLYIRKIHIFRIN